MVSAVISTTPNVVSGAPVFADTRVPVQILWDYLETGGTVDDFLAQHPHITREQAIGALTEAKELLAADAEKRPRQPSRYETAV